MKVCTDSCLFGAWVAAKTEQKIIGPKTIADIGTGTGLLSLMLAQKSGAQMHAVDIDKNSFAQASENFNASPWSERLHAFHSDIKEWKAPCKYDLIIANPPFYENDLMPEDNQKSISKHSSTLGLKNLLLQAKNLLNEHGNFALLLPWARTKWFENAASAYSLFVKEKMEVKQTPLHNYFRSMLLLQNQKTSTIINELIIKNNHNEYTHEFIELLKDYYLYL
jgi:tRNA1Val (adenine37-N6)-methyltransferase